MPRCFLHPVFRGLPLLLLILPLAVGEAGGAEPPTVRAKFPGIEFGILGSARAVPMDEGTLLTGDGFKISPGGQGGFSARGFFPGTRSSRAT